MIHKLPTLVAAMRNHAFKRVKADGGERIEDHCTLDEIYAANTVSAPLLTAWRDEQALLARRRAAERHRREREERMALEVVPGGR